MQGSEDGRWDDVRVFLAAHRLRNLGDAARRLGVDISTVSRRLTAFEATIGARLFERGRHGLAPTRAAEAVLVAAEAMELAHARLGREASTIEASAEGVVRLSAPPGLADMFVIPALAAVRARFPGIVVELETSVRVVDLTRGEADLALRSVRPTSAELVLRRLMHARSVALASPTLARSLGVLRDWSAAPWVGFDHDLASLPAAQWIARHVARASVVLRTSHYASQLAAAALGMGVVLLPTPYARVRGLVEVRHDAALAASAASWPIDSLWLVGHKSQRELPRVAAVWQVLSETLGGVREPEPRRAGRG
ncbi:LysR family transcriptional regulator [Nannocystis punicea]|uniref:LysR family transcriptional regulator n=1 Tax=Nannocystis punicea TaxID=2995304 RepID=A0ABY7HIZ6_9BACT|nr:LysR family transcriptional regulator [Nannocystis poenicansa]WAS98914.1 LysR family transcriptional regulator [Nannocystis poenicansa]